MKIKKFYNIQLLKERAMKIYSNDKRKGKTINEFIENEELSVVTSNNFVN